MDQVIYVNLHYIAQAFADQGWSSELRQTIRALGVQTDEEVGLLLREGKAREAVLEAERFLVKHPGSFAALGAAAAASVAVGDHRRAKEHLGAMYRIAPDDWDWWGLTYRTNYADVLLKSGERDRAMALLDETLADAKALVERGDQHPGVQREIAAIYGARGEVDQAYAWLSRAVDAGWRLEHVHPSPLFDFLRGTPRFHTLIARIEDDILQAKEQVARAGLTLR
jgi:tetratricopeptide (TPR) repeat protein